MFYEDVFMISEPACASSERKQIVARKPSQSKVGLPTPYRSKPSRDQLPPCLS